jgi:hypothetical protein
MQRDTPLYRKVNTRARGVHHDTGGAARHDRNSKRGPSRGMAQGKKRGLDYTPLYRFLLSRVGEDWARVHSEAVARLDREEPVWHIVHSTRDAGKAIVRVGESTYWSGLYVTADGRLAVIDPMITVERLNPLCACCTHTFNGVRFTRPFAGDPAQLLDE